MGCVLVCPCQHTHTTDVSGHSEVSDHGLGSMSTSSYGSEAYPYKSSLQEKTTGASIFTMAELSKGTGDFSQSNKIGQGGFGLVYRCKLRDGRTVAIKRAKKDLFEKRLSVEFKTELDMLSQVDHLNLVKLIGYLEAEHEHILVMEYVPNGNLREHLDGKSIKAYLLPVERILQLSEGNYGMALDMSTRLDIAIDVAHALTYLHLYADKPIIHRDVKSSNILLTGKFRAKVADFGFSHVGPSTDVGITHVSTQVKGTLGYLDPEYLTTNQLTTKSDVYSFGILLVEIFTGRNPIELKRPSDERVTFRWVYKNFVEGNLIDILDPNIEKTPETLDAMERLAVLSFACSAPSKKDRPSMKKSVEVLWNIRKDYLAKKQANLNLSTMKTASMHCDSFHNALDSSGHNISTDFSSRTSDAQGSQRHHNSP